MHLARYNDPFAGLTSLHSQLDEMFNNFFSGSNLPALASSMPATDVYTEDDKQLVAEVQAPGFKPEDIEINIREGVLEIKGQRQTKEENEDSKRSYVVRESTASFYRSIALPKQADIDGISADFEDGVLRVSVPFKELPAPKKVAIGTGSKKK